MSNTGLKVSLYAARVNKGISRRKACEATGISYEMLGRFENGKVEPRASDLQKLCALYEVGIEDLRFDNVTPVSRSKDGVKK